MRRVAEDEAQAGTVTILWSYDRPLETVSSFKYPGRLLAAIDDNWTVLITNIQKSRKSWFCMDQILEWEGADNRMSGSFMLLLYRPSYCLCWRFGW